MTGIAERRQQQQQPIRSTIPVRLDRLRWTPFHTRLITGLGTAWVLDGLSVTIASSVSGKADPGQHAAPVHDGSRADRHPLPRRDA